MSKLQIFKKSGTRILIGILCVCSCSFTVFAQGGKRITGTVADEKGEPVIGANVIEKGTTNGNITDVDGNFSLEVSPGATLIVSFIGYNKQEIPVGSQTNLTVTLIEDAEALEEVVVVGYGTQKKVNLTGAISTIKSTEIMTTTSTSLAQRLQGKIPGLQIRQNSGSPGTFDAMINIRGFGTPLFVIDGIARDGGNEFQRLNAEDIESVSVLKDALAAVYGLNAANGVIIITTKQGNSGGKTKFSYNGTTGMNAPTEMPKMSTATQWMEMRNDASVNMGLAPLFSQEEMALWRQGGPGYESTDWYDETMKKWATQQQHTFSARGGNDKVNFYTSLGYLKEDGLLKSNAIGYDRYTFRSNMNAKLAEGLSLGLELGGRYDQRKESAWSIFDIIRGTVSQLPMNTPYANNNPEYPSYTTDGQSFNPVATSNSDLAGYRKNTNKNLQSAAHLTWNIPWVPGLSVKGLASYDYTSDINKNLYKSFKWFAYDAANDSYSPTTYGHPTTLYNGFSDGNRITMQAQVNYNKVFNESHTVGATAVYEERHGWSRSAGLQREFDFYTVDQIDMGDQTNQKTSGMENQWGNRSLLGRVNYDYLGKYLFTVAARYDGSYRYHPDYRWGLFPVVTAGWRISDESFFKNNVSFITNLKLRGSLGKIGEDTGDPFQYVEAYSTGGAGFEFANGTWVSGVSAPTVVNRELSWMTSTIKDFGFDLGLFGGQVQVEFDIYQRDREGLLAYRNATLPNTFGASLPQENLNKDRVKGIEFSAAYAFKVNDVAFNVSGNFNFARRMVVYAERGPFVNSMDKWRSGQNERWSDVVWMYDYAGQFQSEEEILNSAIQGGTLGNSREMPGDFRYTDANGDGVIDGNDATPLEWGETPKMFYGLTVGAKWKGFDFYMLWQGAAKYSVMMTHAYATMFWNNSNLPEYFYDRWHRADPYDPNSEWITGEWPANRMQADVGAMYNESSMWRRDASYLRLKSLELGYSFNLKKMGIEELRLFVDGYNLWTICDKYVKPFDPEKVAGNLNTGWVYPLSRSFNFGLSLSF